MHKCFNKKTQIYFSFVLKYSERKFSMDNNLNINGKINFGNLYASASGARKLVKDFEDKELLKKIIDFTKNNISADVFVKENEILVKPHQLTGKPTMRIRGLVDNEKYSDRYNGYRVDYFEHDIYPAAKNAYYNIDNKIISGFPSFETKKTVNAFGRLFDAACHIAADIDKSFHDKIVKASKKEKELDKIVKNLGINIINETIK